MATVTSTSATTNRTSAPFHDGMRLSRSEFRRLRDARPDVRRAERLDGALLMPAATRHLLHGKPHRRFEQWLSAYELATEGVDGSLACTVALGADHDPEPDSILFIAREAGGKCIITKEDYLEGAPELVVEIGASTAAIDLGRKRRIYESHGVDEYIVWLTESAEIRWFHRRDGQFEPLAAGPDGILRSVIFPGLWLDVAAMLRLDMRRVLDVLNQGLATPEHAAFAARLREQMQRPQEMPTDRISDLEGDEPLPGAL